MAPVIFPRKDDPTFYFFSLKQLTFKDYGLCYRGCNNFGQVESGWIRLVAPLASFASPALGEAWEVKPAARRGWFEIFDIQHTGGRAWALLDFDQEETEELRLLFLLRECDQSFGDKIGISGILVKVAKNLSREECEDLPSQARNSQIFRRVGSFYIEEDVSYEEIHSALDEMVTEVFLA